MTLDQLIALFLLYKYWIIFGVTVVEGPVIMLLSGVMLKMSIVNFWVIFPILVVADLVGDAMWYWVGYFYAHKVTEKWGKFIGLTPELLEKSRRIFVRHQSKIIFLSKITMGFGLNMATFLTAGMTRVSFKKYMALNLAGQIIWTSMLLWLGYIFGDVSERFGSGLRFVFLSGLIATTLLIMADIRSYLKKRNAVE